MFSVSVVIAVRDHREELLRLLADIAAQSARVLEVVIVDDGSEAPLRAEELHSFPNVQLLRLPKSKGEFVARNLGIRSCRGTHVAFLDADACISNTWIEKALAGFSHKDIGAVASLIFERYDEKIVNNAGHGLYADLSETHRFAGATSLEVPMVASDIFGPCFAAALFSRVALDAIGSFDETLGCHACTDYVLRMHLQGYRCVYVPSAIAFHSQRNHPAPGQLPSRKLMFYWERNRLIALIRYADRGTIAKALGYTARRFTTSAGAARRSASPQIFAVLPVLSLSWMSALVRFPGELSARKAARSSRATFAAIIRRYAENRWLSSL